MPKSHHQTTCRQNTCQRALRTSAQTHTHTHTRTQSTVCSSCSVQSSTNYLNVPPYCIADGSISYTTLFFSHCRYIKGKVYIGHAQSDISVFHPDECKCILGTYFLKLYRPTKALQTADRIHTSHKSLS